MNSPKWIPLGPLPLKATTLSQRLRVICSALVGRLQKWRPLSTRQADATVHRGHALYCDEPCAS